VLNASEINENLMNQSVMVFSNATARAAALTSPVEGMLTWLEDVNRYENYNGTAWVELGSAPGMVHLNTTSFSAQSSIMINNVFSTTYDFYEVYMAAIGTGGATGVSIRLASSGTAATGNNYARQRMLVFSSTTYEASSATATSFSIGGIGSSNNGVNKLTLSNPANAQATGFLNLGGRIDNQQFQVGHHNLATAYDGINFFPDSGTITGTISIYGLRK
jgi:hypothetical protein